MLQNDCSNFQIPGAVIYHLNWSWAQFCLILPIVIYLILYIKQQRTKSGQRLLTACANTPGSWHSASAVLYYLPLHEQGLEVTSHALHKGTLSTFWDEGGASHFFSSSAQISLLSTLSSSPWWDHTTPRSLSVKDLLPFPTTAMTQMRLLYHCQ